MNWRATSAGLTAAACLVLATPARADDCPGGGDPCPYSSVRVVGEDGHGVFRLAQALALSPDGGRGYVGDSASYRIQVFPRDGLFIRQFGRYGSGAGEIQTVGGIATDAQGRVAVLDSANDRVEIFAPDGAYLGAWGTTGTGLGQFDLGTNGGI